MSHRCQKMVTWSTNRGLAAIFLTLNDCLLFYPPLTEIRDCALQIRCYSIITLCALLWQQPLQQSAQDKVNNHWADISRIQCRCAVKIYSMEIGQTLNVAAAAETLLTIGSIGLYMSWITGSSRVHNADSGYILSVAELYISSFRRI